MLVAVISDSHDHVDMIVKAVDLANQRECGILLVLGELVSPFSMTAMKTFKGRVIGVFGNNDGDLLRLQQAASQIGADFSPDPLRIEIQGKRFLLMHEPFLLEEAAISGRYDYVLYGHLHKVDQRLFGRCRVLNPGELGGWLGESTMMLIDLDADRVEIINLEPFRMKK